MLWEDKELESPEFLWVFVSCFITLMLNNVIVQMDMTGLLVMIYDVRKKVKGTY